MPFHKRHKLQVAEVFGKIVFDTEMASALSSQHCPPQISSLLVAAQENVEVNYIESASDCIRVKWTHKGVTSTARYKPSLAFITIQVYQGDKMGYTIQMDKRVGGIVDNIDRMFCQIFDVAKSMVKTLGDSDEKTI